MFGKNNYEIVDATTRAAGRDNRPIEHDIDTDFMLSVILIYRIRLYRDNKRENKYFITKPFIFFKFCVTYATVCYCLSIWLGTYVFCIPLPPSIWGNSGLYTRKENRPRPRQTSARALPFWLADGHERVPSPVGATACPHCIFARRRVQSSTRR